MKFSQHLTLEIWRAMWNASHFLDFYLGECQKNGVQSYRKVFPNAKYMSAKASASRMLKKQRVLPARWENGSGRWNEIIRNKKMFYNGPFGPWHVTKSRVTLN